MTTLQYIHFSVELWGAIFCFISTVSIGINRDFDKAGSHKLIALMLCSGVLMVSDALAWLFRGNPGEAGYYIVRFSPALCGHYSHFSRKNRLLRRAACCF